LQYFLCGAALYTEVNQ